ncbi:hypothetical protein BO85DRAFT_472921 [Aspergillus piperis CBS 112811]|uniref:Uncharacterized protein n=1 Tax=Aspergillus piperis CBS 112811 TaxID=1448313 RepID=A0A8G1QR18_9EURO|nr:hypothetical protein BO85DRAFT_472921 [Aspergillus piperis CBS 112811]RAH52068.1 hypothetical protein BO85DRAFT_472921 [Aspergillus piperis CBS 112811]
MKALNDDSFSRPEYPVIDELVQNAAVSPAEAVQNLLRVREVLHQERQESESPSDIDGNHTWYAMTKVVDTANITPADEQDKLIDFIFELHRTKVIDPATGEEPTAVDLKLWTEVPYLSIYLTDFYYFNFTPEYARQVDEDPQKEYPPSDLQEWENRNSFMAHLTRRAEYLCHYLDASLYAFYSCRSAFEEGPLIEEAVRTACIWYIYAGQRVWENCQAGRLFGDEDQTPRRDMHMDRWRLWKDGLRAAQREFPRESTQEMIRKALEEIKKAEHEK